MLRGGVGKGEFSDLGMGLEGHEEQHIGSDAELLAVDAGIVHAVSALILVERGLAGFPTGVPYRVAILDIEITATGVHRYAVVAIAGDAAEFGILVEGISSGGVGDEREEIFCAKIVDPGPRCAWLCDHIFSVEVIEMTVLLHLIVSVRITYILLQRGHIVAVDDVGAGHHLLEEADRVSEAILGS